MAASGIRAERFRWAVIAAAGVVGLLQESGLIVAGVFGFAVLLHFMLVFPEERRILGRKAAMPVIYARPGL
jgi:hypothetical protein